MLLWIGAILCYVAYTIEVAKNPETLSDNVSGSINIYENIA
jgi:sodium/potassium-transporting ATPase subunit alpha